MHAHDAACLLSQNKIHSETLYPRAALSVVETRTGYTPGRNYTRKSTAHSVSERKEPGATHEAHRSDAPPSNAYSQSQPYCLLRDKVPLAPERDRIREHSLLRDEPHRLCRTCAGSARDVPEWGEVGFVGHRGISIVGNGGGGGRHA